MIFQRCRNCCSRYSEYYSLGHSWILYKPRLNSLPEVTANSLLFSESQTNISKVQLVLILERDKFMKISPELSYHSHNPLPSGYIQSTLTFWQDLVCSYVVMRDARFSLESRWNQDVFGFLFLWVFNLFLGKILSRCNLGIWIIWQRFEHIFVATKGTSDVQKFFTFGLQECKNQLYSSCI